VRRIALLSSPTARRFGVGLFWESANFNSQQKSRAFSTDRQKMVNSWISRTTLSFNRLALNTT
jgi:hypothetical protein